MSDVLVIYIIVLHALCFLMWFDKGYGKKLIAANRRTIIKYMYRHPEYSLDYTRFILTPPQIFIVELVRRKGVIDAEAVSLCLKVNLKSAKLMLDKLTIREYLNCINVTTTEGNKTSKIYTPAMFDEKLGVRYSVWWSKL